MSIKDYRQKIEREIEQAKARGRERMLDATAEGPTAVEAISAAGGLRLEEDVQQIRDLVTDRSADEGMRAIALEAVSATGDDEARAREAALERLADGDESPAIRRVALQLLKHAAISSPSFDTWRPRYLEAARQAIDSDDLDLRLAALEVLAQQKDRYAQERLIAGLRDPARALVPAADALQLLTYDVHAEVLEVAAQIAENPPDDRARIEALHVLASEPTEAERFARLFTDDAEDLKVREVSATALSSLDPSRFHEVAKDVVARAQAAAALEAAPGSAARKAQGLLLHTRALLELDD